MKKLIIILIALTIFSIKAQSQEVTVMDLYTVQASTEIDVIHNYLVNNKNFTYLKNYSEKKDKDGWSAEVYVFVQNQNIIKIKIASKVFDGKLERLTQVEYKIYTKSEYVFFVKSLDTFSFTVHSTFITDENNEVIVYSKKNSFKIFAITNMGEYYRVAL